MAVLAMHLESSSIDSKIPFHLTGIGRASASKNAKKGVTADKSLYHSLGRGLESIPRNVLRTASTPITAHQQATIVTAFRVPRATVLPMNFAHGEPSER